MAAAAHRGDDPPEQIERKSLLQDEADAEIERLRTAHGEVVDRAVDGERADVAAGKDQRPHHVGIGREGESAPPMSSTAPSWRRSSSAIGEGRADDRIEEPRHRPAAAAMGELDGLALSGTVPGRLSAKLVFVGHR